MSFVFYDTETTGIDTSFDQILQFAAILTDEDLNELDRFEIRCRLLPNTVPAPRAMQTNRVAAAHLSLPSHYTMIRRVLEIFEKWTPATFIGFNSIHFDEHLFRHALYKTLHPPYFTNTKGNARTDAMRMIQAASLFSPSALVIPVGDRGQPIFKLDCLAPANGFKHDLAHDALADAEATLFLCRLLSKRAPKIWSSFVSFSKKATVSRFVASEEVFCLADYYFSKPYSSLVTTIGNNTEITSEFYVFDLANDPAPISKLTDAGLMAWLHQSPKPVRRVKCNAAPIVVPVDAAICTTSASFLTKEEIRRRATVLKSNNHLRSRIVAALETLTEIKPPSIYVEKQLYDSFISDYDEQLIRRFHDVPWEERIEIIRKLSDCRLKELGHQLIGFERPDLLSETERSTFVSDLAERVVGVDADAPWLTLPKAIDKITELLDASTGEDVELLRGHHQFLTEWFEQAMSCLDRNEVSNEDVYLAVEEDLVGGR